MEGSRSNDFFWTTYDEKMGIGTDFKADTFYLQLEIFMKYKEMMPMLEKFDANIKKLKVRRKQLRSLRKPLKLHFKCLKKVDHIYQKKRHSKYLKSVRSKYRDEVETLDCECRELSNEVNLLLEALFDLMVTASKQPVLLVNGNDDYILIRAMKEIFGFKGYVWVKPDLKRLIRRMRKKEFKILGDEEA